MRMETASAKKTGDVFTKAKRSEVMSRIRSRGNRDTELVLARLLRANHITGWRRHLLIRATVESRWLSVEGRKPRKTFNSQLSTLNLPSAPTLFSSNHARQSLWTAVSGMAVRSTRRGRRTGRHGGGVNWQGIKNGMRW